MNKLALVVCVLGACKSDEDYKRQKPPEETQPAEVEVEKKAPPPRKRELTPEELGSCELEASGAVSFKQTSPGGRNALNVSYWLSAEEANKMAGVNGFAVHCHGTDARFSILPSGKKDGMPFGPKTYSFKNGAGDASLMVTLGPKITLGDLSGTVDITRFDKARIVGKIALTGKMVPGGGKVTLSGAFDYACPGLAGCE